MRELRCLLLPAVVVIGVLASPPANGADPQVEWAKGIADDFWKALLNDQPEQAAGLLSPELSKSLQDFQWPGIGANWRPFEKPAKEALNRLGSKYGGPDIALSTDSVRIAPDRSEVVFKGTLSGKNRWEKNVAAEYTMRVARESNGGKWGIRFFLITEPPVKKR